MLMMILIPLLAWIAYVVWFRRGQERFLFPPDRRPMVLADAGIPDFHNVWTSTGGGTSLEGWHLPAEGFTKPTILILPGRLQHPGTCGPLARLLADAGFGVLLAGLRGQGGNPGAAGQLEWAEDAGAWADFLVKRGVSGGRLVLYGRDTGALLAAGLAAERSVARLVLEAPFTSMAELLERRLPFLPLRSLLHHRFEAASILAQVQAPTLILHAGGDRQIPVALGQRLDRLVTAPLQVFRPDGVAADDLLARGGGEVLLSFLDASGASPQGPTLEQEKPSGGRSLVVRD
ncbi:alpha/beta hydrolase [Niveispirillum sp. KHB5.9]|uniref:alpha/beta hydrolase n=1 Tax=Niveispirillum sp. KHB5.9 TaxID=3400269 RepID=UPI003A887845